MTIVSKTWLASLQRGRNGTEREDTLTSNLPIFPWIHPPLHPKLLELIFRLGVPHTLSPDDPIFEFPQKVDKFVVVTKGVMGRSIGDPNAQSFQAFALSPPGHIAAGNLNLISGRPALGRYFALTPGEVIACPREIFLSVVRTDYELFNILLLQLEICSLSDRFGFACLSLLEAEDRMKVFIISWSVFFGQKVFDEDTRAYWIKIPYPLSRRARSLITRTSKLWVDHILKDWKDKDVWRRKGEWEFIRCDHLEDTYSWLRKTEDKSSFSYPAKLEELIQP